MRPCICFSRFGPYHLSRLRAAAKVFPRLIAMEWSSVDSTYAWANETGDEDLDWRTLFSDRSPDQITVDEILRALDAAFANGRPDVIVLNGWGFRTSLAALLFAKRHGIPTVVMSESTPWDANRNPLKEWVKRRIVREFDAALVGGRAHADYLVQLGMAADRIFLGYDVVDNDYFREKALEIRDSRLGKEEINHPQSAIHDLPQFPNNPISNIHSPFFLASARFIEKKNHIRLVEAYEQYAGRVSREEAWNLVILGDGELRPKLIARCQDLGHQVTVSAPWESSPPPDSCPLAPDSAISNSHLTPLWTSDPARESSPTVYFPGFQQYQELPHWYADASAFVHPSTVEQWGLVVNEAMASSLPVIVSERCGCAGELVREGENGFLIDPFDVRSLAEALIRMHQLPLEERRLMGEKAARQVADFGPERFADGLEGALQSVAGLCTKPLSWIQKTLIRALAR